MAKMLRRLVRLAPLALLFAGSAIAQNTSSITGVVTDASTGKPVVGAVVVVTSPAAEGEQTVVTEAGGKFTVPDLPAGSYTLSVQMDGYKPFERADHRLARRGIGDDARDRARALRDRTAREQQRERSEPHEPPQHLRHDFLRGERT